MTGESTNRCNLWIEGGHDPSAADCCLYSYSHEEKKYEINKDNNDNFTVVCKLTLWKARPDETKKIYKYGLLTWKTITFPNHKIIRG